MQFKNTKSIFNPSDASLKHWCKDNGLPLVLKKDLTSYRTLCYLIEKKLGFDMWGRKYPPVRLYRDMVAWVDYVHPKDVSRLFRALLRLKRIKSK